MHSADNPMMVIFIEEHEYLFSVANVDERSWEWLGGVIADHLQQAYDRGLRGGRTEVREGIKKALGL